MGVFRRHEEGVRFRYKYEFVILSKLERLELQSRYGGHVVKTQLQLMCCALIWELGCLGILESRKERVSKMRCGVDGET